MPESEQGQPITGKSRHEIVRALRQAMGQWEARGPADDRPRVSSGCEALDRLLPARGFVRGTLIEWLGTGLGSGAGTLALLAAREAMRGGGPLVVLDHQHAFYPPAVATWGIDPARLLLVRPTNDKDTQWSLDQILRCAQVAAVLSWLDRLEPRTFRRLQLAVETSGGLGLLVRPETARTEPSWAAVRWLVHPQASSAGWRLHVRLLRLHDGLRQGEAVLEIDPETGTVQPTKPNIPAATVACRSVDGSGRAGMVFSCILAGVVCSG